MRRCIAFIVCCLTYAVMQALTEGSEWKVFSKERHRCQQHRRQMGDIPHHHNQTSEIWDTGPGRDRKQQTRHSLRTAGNPGTSGRRHSSMILMNLALLA